MSLNLSSFLQWRFNVFLYLTFGWNFTRILIFILGRVYFLLNKKGKKDIEKAVSEVLTSTEKKTMIPDITRKVFQGILSHYYEKVFIAYEDPVKATLFLNTNIISHELAKLRSALSKGRGIVMVTGHYGAIEYIPTLLAVNGFPVSMIGKFKTKQLKKKSSHRLKSITSDSLTAMTGAIFSELP